MTKKDIAQVVAQRADVSATAAEEILGAALDVIGEQLAKGEDVRLAGFGTFETRERAARTGRNPQTGAEIAIAASTSVGFKAGRAAQARGQRLTPAAPAPPPTGRRPHRWSAPRRTSGCDPAPPRSQEHFGESGAGPDSARTT